MWARPGDCGRAPRRLAPTRAYIGLPPLPPSPACTATGDSMPLVRSRLAPVVAALLAVAIVALGVTQPPTTALAADDYLVIGRAELLALPTSGTAWDFVKSTADATWGPVDLANQDSKVGSQAIAAALVYARTGDTTYRAKVVGAL